MFRLTKKSAVKDWNAEAEVVEKAELQHFIDKRGILMYDAYTRGNKSINQRLANEVRREWYEEVTRPSKLAVAVEIIFGIPANRI